VPPQETHEVLTYGVIIMSKTQFTVYYSVSKDIIMLFKYINLSL